MDMLSSVDVWDDRAARSAACQMACDEALLLVAENPSLRIYRWSAPAATFGYAQKLADVRLRTRSLPAVRRWTGGGIVFHGDDLTIALAVPVRFDLVREKPGEIYRRIHGALLPALEAYFPDARLALPGDRIAGPACFEAPALHDIISGGVKVCGGALRRSRHGMLYQGSVHISEADCAMEIARAFSPVTRLFAHTIPFEERVTLLEAERYGTAGWNAMR